MNSISNLIFGTFHACIAVKFEEFRVDTGNPNLWIKSNISQRLLNF